jgi:hypothetical protein
LEGTRLISREGMVHWHEEVELRIAFWSWREELEFQRYAISFWSRCGGASRKTQIEFALELMHHRDELELELVGTRTVSRFAGTGEPTQELELGERYLVLELAGQHDDGGKREFYLDGRCRCAGIFGGNTNWRETRIVFSAGVGAPAS